MNTTGCTGRDPLAVASATLSPKSQAISIADAQYRFQKVTLIKFCSAVAR